MKPATSEPPPKPGHADTLKPTTERVEEDNQSYETDDPQSQEQMLSHHTDTGAARTTANLASDAELAHWEPKPPKVLMKDPDAVPLQLQSQIQMYATTE